MEVEERSRFEEMNLHPKSLKALRRQGLHKQTEIQEKTFDVILPIGRPCRKKIAYMNQWDKSRIFLLRTSHPRMLKVKGIINFNILFIVLF